MDQIGAVLKRAMPFQTVSPEMLQQIVKLATTSTSSLPAA
jgi:NitT/TauT family transport system permease protein